MKATKLVNEDTTIKAVSWPVKLLLMGHGANNMLISFLGSTLAR